MKETLIWVLKQWETLKEKKNALRTHAATKGVSLKVSLKTCYFLTNISN